LPILPLLLVAQMFFTFTNVYSNFLLYFEKTHLSTLAGLFVSGISFVLGYLLVPIWGIFGSAICAVISGFFYFILNYFWTQLSRKKYLTAYNKATVSVNHT
jgi:O-antigen/teichoic acid export membrane protein